ARCGRAASAAGAPPYRSIRVRKVRGQTFSLRISRNQSSRWVSESWVSERSCSPTMRPMFSFCSSGVMCVRQARASAPNLMADLAFGAGDEPRDVGVMLRPQQDGEQREQLRLLQVAVEPQEQQYRETCEQAGER